MDSICETLEDVKLKYNLTDKQVRLIIRFLPNKHHLLALLADADDAAEIQRIAHAQLEYPTINSPIDPDIIAEVELTKKLAIAEIIKRRANRIHSN